MKPQEIAATLPKILTTSRTPFIWGDPGIGKSDVMRQVAADLKLDLIDARLSIYDPTDLKGFPMVKGTGKNEAMHFVPPAILPTKDKGILFLDELPAAPPSVQAAAYQLILDKKLGEYTLPPGWRIVAAGNYARNGGVHYSLAPALANRFIHLEMQCCPDSWDTWAASAGIDPLTRAFLRFKPGLLHDMEARKGGIAFPSPRTWAFADELTKLGLAPNALLEALKGTIGEGAAIEFLAFIRMAGSLPSASEILLSPDTAPVPESPGAKHAVASMLENVASTTNFKQCMDYMSRLEVEYQVMFMNNITKHKRELCSTREHVQWCLANKEVLGITS